VGLQQSFILLYSTLRYSTFRYSLYAIAMIPISSQRLLIASDHAGFRGKEAIKLFLARQGVKIEDLGPPSEDSVDYPDFAERVARAVARGEADAGILVCGSGIGMQIAANKIPGIRAALAWNEETARLSRQHNDANILAVGARTTRPEVIEEIVNAFLSTPFEGGRHQQRLDKIGQLESASRPDPEGVR
jgi:ribose 5-phosphate isomerase B